MCQHRRILPSTRRNSNLFPRTEEVVAYYRIVDFGFKDMVKAFLAEFLQCLGSLEGQPCTRRRRTLRMGRRM
jgi:hypothetical protein